MARYKKKLTKDEMQELVVNWSVDQLEEMKDMSMRIMSDRSIPNEDFLWIFGGIARQVTAVLDLFRYFDHEEDKLVEWAEDFIEEYSQEANDYSYRSLN